MFSNRSGKKMSVTSLTQQQGKQQRVMQKTVFHTHTVLEWPPALTTLSQFTADELKGAWIRRKPGSVPSASGFTHLITLEFSWGLSVDKLEHYLLPMFHALSLEVYSVQLSRADSILTTCIPQSSLQCLLKILEHTLVCWCFIIILKVTD